MSRFPIPPELDGARLDAALHALAPAVSRRAARRLCDAGAVALDGVRAAASARARAGGEIAFDAATSDASLLLGLRVVDEDPDWLVIEKPAGLASHGGPKVDDSVAKRLAAHRSGAGLAQRLDRGASGLLVIGAHQESLRALAASMESGAIARTYLAIAAGAPAEDAFTIELPLRILDEPMGNQSKVVVDREAGLAARTRVRVLERFPTFSLLEVELDTGRTHQIRAHLAAVGHPLLGDPRYGNPNKNAWARETHGVARPLLHAARLRLPHPRTGEPRAYEAFGDPDFARLV
jgi:RluA family pseudouridine synthase